MRPKAVLDASAALHLALRQPDSREIASELEHSALVLVPGIFVPETANALWKYTKGYGLTGLQALERLTLALSYLDVTVPDAELVEEALFEAVQWQHPVYDLLYLVLARRHAAPVITRDGRLRELAGKLGLQAV